MFSAFIAVTRTDAAQPSASARVNVQNIVQIISPGGDEPTVIALTDGSQIRVKESASQLTRAIDEAQNGIVMNFANTWKNYSAPI
jgi:hypothetical protein